MLGWNDFVKQKRDHRSWKMGKPCQLAFLKESHKIQALIKKSSILYLKKKLLFRDLHFNDLTL